MQALMFLASLTLATPSWLYPLNPPSPQTSTPVLDGVHALHVPGSHASFTEAQLDDVYSAPDWFPDSHSTMPTIVARGHAPGVLACGYCHTPAGHGRPENASLSGLPAPYILQQLADFKSGARRAAWPGAYPPADLMIQTAKSLEPADAAAAAAYFAHQTLKPHVNVVEVSRVPRSIVVGWVYAADPAGGDELLGSRLLEFAPDPKDHEKRDDTLQYVAYVPKGSLKRGGSIAHTGAGQPAQACESCHGDRLQGVGLIPPLGGRSPTYLLRQLFAFKTGARAGPTGLPMREVVSQLSVDDMIAVCAYAASLGSR